MIKLSTSVCIEAPVETVWAHLARLEDIELWSDAVKSARCETGLAHGVGAERTCEIAGNRTIKERWVAWEEGRSFTYEGFGVPMMQRAVNHWSVHPQGEKTLLTSEAELELKGGVFAKILEPMVGPLMRKVTANSLAPFKYLVEHGHPYQGKVSKLPLAPAIC